MGNKRRISTCRLRRAEQLEHRLCLSGIAMAQPFEDVDNFGNFRDWHLNYVNAPEVWAEGFTGEGVIVAIVDTGVNYQHDDLNENIWINEGEIPDNGIDDDDNGFIDDVRGWDFYDDDNDPIDELDHGSHIAGIVASEQNESGSTGVAHGATVMPVRVLGGEDGTGNSSDIAAGIVYAVDNGARVVNVSIGSDGPSRWTQRAISYARNRDVLVVAAAGNESADAPNYPAAYSTRYNNVISVGAYSRALNIATFSNKVGDSNVIQVDAPGVGIYSTTLENNYANFAGTSMAVPIVSGIAALALQADPSLSASQLRDLIVDGATIDVIDSDSIGGVNAAQIVATAWEPFRPAVAQIPGDLDGDGEVGLGDYLILSGNFGFTEATIEEGDLDGDGLVGFSDYLALSGFIAAQNAASNAVGTQDVAAESDDNTTIVIDTLDTAIFDTLQ